MRFDHAKPRGFACRQESQIFHRCLSPPCRHDAAGDSIAPNTNKQPSGWGFRLPEIWKCVSYEPGVPHSQLSVWPVREMQAFDPAAQLGRSIPPGAWLCRARVLDERKSVTDTCCHPRSPAPGIATCGRPASWMATNKSHLPLSLPRDAAGAPRESIDDFCPQGAGTPARPGRGCSFARLKLGEQRARQAGWRRGVGGMRFRGAQCAACPRARQEAS